MPRYFESFIVDEPLTEISEQQARDSGWYVVEANRQGVRRLEVFSEGKLDRVVFPETAPSPAISALQRGLDAKVPTWIASAPVREGDQLRYTLWYYEPGGRLEKRVDTVDRPGLYTSSWFDAEGRLGGTLERRFDEYGELIEVVEILPDGRRIIVDD